MEPWSTALWLAALGVLLCVAGLASPLSQRLGVPALVLFLLLGIAAGEDGILGIPFDDYALSFRLGVVALALILFDGGLNTSPAVFRKAVVPAALLATFGVAITAAIVALAGIWLGLPAPIAVLAGGVVSSTDAAAVFAVLRGSHVRLHEDTGAILEVESGLNDPMAVLLTVAATEYLLGTDSAGWTSAWRLLPELGIGAACGAGLGRVGLAVLPRLALPAAGLYPVVTVGMAFAAFGIATMLGGSGFLSVYLTALVLGSGALPYRAGVRRVHDALAWLAQVLMFVMLGLLVFPSQLWRDASTGLALAAVLALVARPAAVLLLLMPFRLGWHQRGFIAWVGLRGAVPIVLATYPVLRGIPAGERLFHLIFFITIVNSLIPGTTVAWLARRLGLVRGADVVPPASVELVSLRDYQSAFVWYYVRQASAVTGALVRDLPLPEACALTVILRGADVVAPRGHTRLQTGDHVCVFVAPADRALLDLLFGQPSDE